jgi:hypothetical protein
MLRLILALLSFYLIYEFWLKPLLRADGPKTGNGPGRARRIEDWKETDLHRRRHHRPSADTEDADYEEIK